MTKPPIKIKDDIIFEGRIDSKQGIAGYTDTITSATPDVSDREILKCSNDILTITNFLKGFNTQKICLLGNANTTIANNANIHTSTGADKVLVTGKVYLFINIDDVWYELTA